MARIRLEINGKKITKEVSDNTMLSDFLRDKLALTGTHVGCDTSQCGACVVDLEGNYTTMRRERKRNPNDQLVSSKYNKKKNHNGSKICRTRNSRLTSPIIQTKLTKDRLNL